jgi:hypothetical protein
MDLDLDPNLRNPFLSFHVFDKKYHRRFTVVHEKIFAISYKETKNTKLISLEIFWEGFFSNDFFTKRLFYFRPLYTGIECSQEYNFFAGTFVRKCKYVLRKILIFFIYSKKLFAQEKSLEKITNFKRFQNFAQNTKVSFKRKKSLHMPRIFFNTQQKNIHLHNKSIIFKTA